jgi:hypothetical protein
LAAAANIFRLDYLSVEFISLENFNTLILRGLMHHTDSVSRLARAKFKIDTAA